MTNYFDEAVKRICESVRFDSSLAKYSSKFPFGRGAADCLCHFLKLAETLGFETENYDNYIGEVIFGSGKEEFAILCHLDVEMAENGKFLLAAPEDDFADVVVIVFRLESKRFGQLQKVAKTVRRSPSEGEFRGIFCERRVEADALANALYRLVEIICHRYSLSLWALLL